MTGVGESSQTDNVAHIFYERSYFRVGNGRPGCSYSNKEKLF